MSQLNQQTQQVPPGRCRPGRHYVVQHVSKD